MTDEQKNAVHQLQISICKAILNLDEELIWDIIASYIDGQTIAAVEKVMKEGEQGQGG